MIKNIASIKISFYQIGYILMLSLLFTSCKKEETKITPPVSGPDQVFYALSDNSLYRFNALDIKSLSNKITITGLSTTTEKLLDIDFRPATGDMYGVSDASKIYIIDAYGAARVVGNAFIPGIAQNATASIDFDPVLDQIRLISSTGQNVRINPETGMLIATDTPISATVANISGIAYTNSIAGIDNTVLYNINLKDNKLYKQQPANSGTLVAVGDLGNNLGRSVSLDISPDNKNALAIGIVSDTTKLFSIDLSKGTTRLSGRFPKIAIQGIAMPLNPVAYAIDELNNLLILNTSATNGTITTKKITGLQAGETILGIDMRPIGGRLYALGSSSRLYTINLSSGVSTQVGTGVLSTLLNGTSFGFDFNPINDRIRVISNTGQNLVINPDDGSIVVGTGLASTATVSAAAYSNNFKGANTTNLYVIDHTTNRLYTQDLTTAALTSIGDLKIAVESTNGFDIISTKTNNVGYAIFGVAGKYNMYSVDLTSGIATSRSDEFTNKITAFTLGLRFP